MLAGVIVLAVIAAVHSFNADKARAVLPGVWVGSVSSGYFGGPMIGLLNIQVSADGKITGTGKTCTSPIYGGELSYTITGDTDGSTVVHVEWDSTNYSFALNGALPDTAQNPLTMHGALLHSPFGSPTVDLSMHHDSETDYTYRCSKVLSQK